MALYTGRGDTGKTSFFGDSQRFSKASLLAEALGCLDELNSYIGLCKVKSQTCHIKLDRYEFNEILKTIQDHLFIIQASLAGAPLVITDEKTKFNENLINLVEIEIPPIKNFIISGGSEISAMLDVARTLARQAERRTVTVHQKNKTSVKPETLVYLNRLSSLLYALARYANFKLGIKEENPSYN
jgi:cob(I)alamin adenosyltransferase